MKESHTHRITIFTTLGRVPIILQALSDEYDQVTVLPVEQPATTPKKRGHYYTNGKHNKGIRGEDLVLKTLAESGGTSTLKRLGKEFAKHGFSEHSASGSLTNLIHSKNVERTGPGTYRLLNAERAHA